MHQKKRFSLWRVLKRPSRFLYAIGLGPVYGDSPASRLCNMKTSTHAELERYAANRTMAIIKPD